MCVCVMYVLNDVRVMCVRAVFVMGVCVCVRFLIPDMYVICVMRVMCNV